MSERKPIFALASYSVEQRNSGWFYGLTNGQERRDYTGPFKSTQAVALAISHQVIREIERRHKRMELRSP